MTNQSPTTTSHHQPPPPDVLSATISQGKNHSDNYGICTYLLGLFLYFHVSIRCTPSVHLGTDNLICVVTHPHHARLLLYVCLLFCVFSLTQSYSVVSPSHTLLFSILCCIVCSLPPVALQGGTTMLPDMQCGDPPSSICRL